jgi:hypothetical protein
MNANLFLSNYPRLFHMAEAGTWKSIRSHGLLSTSAILDLYGISGEKRASIESCFRPECIEITHPKHGKIVIRDNKPLPESKLRRCLTDMSPEEWYGALNARVFFWPTEERVLGLMCARNYRDRPHTIITVDTAELLRAHADDITLSRINSGAAVFQFTKRGRDTFRTVKEWPGETGARNGTLKCKVAEVAVSYAVPDIQSVATEVREMKAGTLIETIWRRG